LAYLASDGPVQDGDGLATKVLQHAIGYTGSPLAFIQLVRSMDRRGELIREVRGKRTYRISLRAHSGRRAAPKPPPGSKAVRNAVDDPAYAEVAAGVLGQVLRNVAASDPTPTGRRGRAIGADRLGALDYELLRARRERDIALSEIDLLTHRLDTATRNLEVLIGALVDHLTPDGRTKLLGPDEQRTLRAVVTGRREAIL
jgi:hypothetical protein